MSREHHQEKKFVMDLGHPMVNRVVDGFVKSAGVGALHAVALDTSKMLCKDQRVHPTPQCIVRRMGKEAAQWGIGAGLYSGLTHGMQEARGKHDWKNAALAGALTGVALSLSDQQNRCHDRMLQSAVTGAAVATAADILLKLSQ